MQLNISYDSTTLASAPSGFFSAVNYVVNLFDTTFTNKSTVNIEVGYGDFPFDGSPVTSLGTSEQNNPVFASYSQVSQILGNEGAPGANTLPFSSPISGQLTLGSAQEKALGLIGANSTLDGWVGIASNTDLQQMTGGSWSFSPTATPSSSQFYIIGVLEHEFSEVMGRTSYLDTSGEYGVMDLYRYAASGVRQTGTGDPAFFSINGGDTNLGNWNDPSISSGDLGDWAPNVGLRLNFKYAGADAFLSESPPGQINGMSATDLTLMAALGWGATPSRPGNQYAFSAPNQTVNLVSTNDGKNLPAAIAGQFNLELVTQPVGTSYPLPSGYQAVAILPGGTGRALQVLSGNMAIDDTGSGDAITLGSGAQTVTGAAHDTIVGGSGSAVINGLAGPESIIGGSGPATVSGGVGDTIAGAAGTLSVDGSLGGQQISGGSSASTILGGAGDTITGSTGSGAAVITGAADDTITGGSGSDLINGILGPEQITGGSGATTVFGGSGDSIVGGAGSLMVVGGVGGVADNNMTITGGGADLQAFNFGAGDSVTGGAGSTIIDDGYGAGGGHNTIIGGSGSQNFLKGNAGDTVIGGGGNNSTIVIDATLGTQSVTGATSALSFAVKVEGGQGDTINTGLAFANQVYVDLGHQTVTGSNNAGTGAFTLVFGGPNDSIVGGVDKLIVPGAAGANTTIVGGAGDLIAVNLGVGDSVVGGSATTLENDSYGAGGNATLIGGSGTATATNFNGTGLGSITVASAVNTLIVAGNSDSIVAGSGSLEARIKSNLAGVETVNLSAAGRGATEVRDVTAGGAGAAASVTGFNTATDKIASATSTSAQLIAASSHDGSGNVVLHFNDSSTMTIAGVTNVHTITFTS